MRTIKAAIAILLMLAQPAAAYLNTYRPWAAIEYDAAEAIALHGAAETFDPDDPILFTDGCELAAGNHTIDELRGYAHLGAAGLTQAQADVRIDRIQIWVWIDGNGNGEADAGDGGSLAWTLVNEIVTANITTGDVVGYEVTGDPPSPETSTWQGDIIQTSQTLSALFVADGESRLFLIRVIDAAGNSNLSSDVGEVENWDNGDTEDGIGSDVAGDQYIDMNGSGVIDDDDIVWVTFAGEEPGPDPEWSDDFNIIPRIERGRGFD